MSEAIHDDIDRIDTEEDLFEEGYVPRITGDLVFYSHPQRQKFNVRNIWVHEDGTTYVRYAGEGKFLCDPVEDVREQFRSGDWQVMSE